MSIVVVGLNHRTAPISLLEKLAINDERSVKALHQLATYEHVVEGVILSTCNRIEIYAVVSKYHAGAQDIRNFLSEFCHVAPEEFVDQLYTYHDDSAVRHLFRVSAGIDSMVLGESEILGQVRRAFQKASDEGLVHRVLGSAFRQALRVGKRVRTETAIGRNPVSVSSAAVELARRAFPASGLSGKNVSIVGAGKMGRLAAQALAAAGATDLSVINRSSDRAEDLAEIFDATALSFDDLEAAVTDSDILICSTTAPQTVIDVAMLERAMQDRGEDRPLFIVDIAVPRDVEPSAAEVTGVVLRDIDDLKEIVDANIGSRMSEVAPVEEIISAEVARFLDWERSTEYAPTAAALVSKADEHRRSELEHIKKLLDDMTPEQRDAVDHLSRRLVSKIMHTPLRKARDAASSKQGYLYLTALRELFELDDDPES